jgi:FkbM family methyltransferase
MKKIFIKIVKEVVAFFEKRTTKKLNAGLKDLLNDDRIVLLDIGAAGDIQPRWKRVSQFLDYIGFEPDQRSYDLLKLQPNACSSFRIINSAVWDSEIDLSINFCRKPMVSSHFYPNRDFLNRFPDKERYDIVSEVTVQTKKLDDQDIINIDFIKLDIQGGELAALKGGQRLLGDCLGAEVEVSFISQYIGQPLFGDISYYMTGLGFEFIDFVHLNRWERKTFNDFGQLVWGDALFLKSPETMVEKYSSDSGKIKKYVAICALYGRFDLIQILEEKLSANHLVNKSLSSIRSSHYSRRRLPIFLNKLMRFMGS